MTTSPSAQWLLPNNTQQNPTLYKGSIDADAAVAQRIVARFNVEPLVTPAMMLLVDPGDIFDGVTLSEVGATTTGNVNATNSVTITGSTSGIAQGQPVTGFYYSGSPSFVQTFVLPANTFVESIAGSTVTLNNAALATQTGVTLIFGAGAVGGVMSGNAPGGSGVINTLPCTQNLFAGMAVTGTGVPANTVINTVNSTTQVTCNNNITAGTGVSFTFAIPAPAANPRIDRVVADAVSGTVSWVKGTESASPSAPAIPQGAVPLAQFKLQTSTTSIPTTLIQDERDLNSLGKRPSNSVNVASAGTTDLGLAKSHFVTVTGTTTITGFGSSASLDDPLYFVTFSGALQLTYNATSMKLPGALNINTTAGDGALFQYLGSGNWACLGYWPASSSPLSANVLRSYLAGYTLSNDGTTPATVLDIAAGTAADSANQVNITLSSGITKTTGHPWVAGSGNAGGIAAVAINTWYHVFAIINSGSADVYFDTSVTAANKPAGTTSFRRIGSFKTDGSGNIIAFVQLGDVFLWSTVVQDYSVGNPSTTATLQPLSVPTGVNVRPVHNVYMEGDSSVGEVALLFTSPAQADTAPGFTALTISYRSGATMGIANTLSGIWTDTSGQVRYRASVSSANCHIYGTTLGWIDTRGRDF